MHQCDCCWDDDDQAQGEVYLGERPIRPLPKRQRLFAPAPPLDSGRSTSHEGKVSDGATMPEYELESDGEEQRTRDGRAAARAREVTAVAGDRRGPDDEDHGSTDALAYEHWLAKRGELPPVARDPDRTADGTSNPLDLGSTASDSPPTSPASVDARSLGEEKEVASGLFGEEGSRIADSLSTASSFSPAGLFGGLGLATLHPSLAAPVQERHYEEEEEEEGDEDTYGVVDRSRPPVEPSFSSQASVSSLGLGGSNKKKRKIPGLNMSGVAAPADEDSTEGEGGAEPVRPPGPRNDLADFGPLKAPVNPPTTAKAALAKLCIRPPHVSLCTSCYSSRRQSRKRNRVTITKHHPLPLPAAPAFIPPAQLREGPPPLPPGSGLKGSKALKAAMKAHREREKEKERVRKLFAHVKVPDLYDPDGTANPSPSFISRSIKADLARRRAEGRTSPSKLLPSAYPTPPVSSDEGESDSDPASASHWTVGLPKLDLFKFRERPSPVLESRWTALNDQKERLKAAKERAAKAREEEKERRKEKELKARAEAAAAADPASAHPAPATPPPNHASTPNRKVSAVSRLPPADVASAPRPPPAAPPAPSQPAAPPPAAALPPPPAPPPASKPKKKGRKKRSAHANAHNMHHRDNYVPSRLPKQDSSHQSESSTPLLTSWPASAEAVAEAGEYASTCGGGHFCSPDEYVCLFCEYELFYGEESLLLKAIRKRKGVLSRRKKAKDRAMKATQGGANGAPATDAGGQEEERQEEPAPVEGEVA
ncbi:hypothetical protein JCM11641_002435 [Rhodosporidiobolus odoratus]